AMRACCTSSSIRPRDRRCTSVASLSTTTTPPPITLSGRSRPPPNSAPRAMAALRGSPSRLSSPSGRRSASGAATIRTTAASGARSRRPLSSGPGYGQRPPVAEGRPTDRVQGLRQCPPRTPRSLLAFPERFQNRPNQLAEKTTGPRANLGQIRLCAHGRCRARTCDLLLVRRVRRLPLVAVSCCYLTNLAFSRRLRERQLPL